MAVYYVVPSHLPVAPVIGSVPWEPKQAVPEVVIPLPTQRYRPVKIMLVPFYKKARFDTFEDAFMFVAKHCQFHHGHFNRNLAKMYLKMVEVFEIVRGGYAVPRGVSKKQFDTAYTAACSAMSGEEG